MPLGDPSSRSSDQSPPDTVPGLGLREETDRWSVPIGQLCGTRLGLSYSAFIAGAILVSIVLTSAGEQGNANLPKIAAMGTVFWVSGWLVQFVTHFGVCRLLNLPLGQLTVGLLGVETLPRNWSASRTLMVTLATTASLLVLGSFYRLVEGGFQMPVLSRDSPSMWTPPSIGFASVDSIWRSAAWLCWVQAICQMYPLPRALGRYMFAALCSLSCRRLIPSTETVVFRRSLTAVALLTAAVALYLLRYQVEGSTPKWPLVMMLAVMLWVSSRAADVPLIIQGFAAGNAQSGPGILETIRAKRSFRRQQQRLKEALEREHTEAVDASRLDDILRRLHSDGIDSLPEEDRKILERVSQNLRRERESKKHD